MKTIQMFKISFANIICLLLTITPLMVGYSQTCTGNQVSITVENMRNTASNTIEFDVYITNTGTTALSLAAIQGSVIYDAAMLDKNASTTFSAVVQPNETGNFPKFENLKTKHSTATNQLRWMQNPVTLSSGNTVTLPSLKKLKYASFRLTSTKPIQSNLVAKMKPQWNVKPGFTNVLATVYCNDNLNSIGLKSVHSELNSNPNMSFTALAYPNPYTDNFHLNITSASENTIEIKVYDMLGKMIESQTIEASEIQNLTIGSNYPSGIYNLNVIQDKNTQSLRIIKR